MDMPPQTLGFRHSDAFKVFFAGLGLEGLVLGGKHVGKSSVWWLFSRSTFILVVAL